MYFGMYELAKFVGIMKNNKKLAIDFDGTIVEHQYPRIGKELPGAFSTLKALQEKGYLLILWTFRSGAYLQEAIDYCRKNGLEFWAINASNPEEEVGENVSRLIQADVFIDDRNLGGFIGWERIGKILL